MTKSKSAPSAVEQLLGCGCFQGLAFVAYQWICFVQAWNTVLMAFGKVMPTKWGFENANDTGIGPLNGTRDPCKCLESANGCTNFTWEGDFYSIVPHVSRKLCKPSARQSGVKNMG